MSMKDREAAPKSMGMRSADRQRVLIGIATAGRRHELSNMLLQLNQQRQLPDEVIICPAGPMDLDESVLPSLRYRTRVVRGAKGLTSQRNLILDLCEDYDLVGFFDDDFYPVSGYVALLRELAVRHTDTVGFTGRPIADGNLTSGISHDDALRHLSRHVDCVDLSVKDTYNLYGCNMAFRVSAIVHSAARFDEKLPLYGWLEDVDFSRQVAKAGRLVYAPSLTGVHLATKRGRSSGYKFGYSQVANPVYLARKGTLAKRAALMQILRNVARNAERTLFPEWWIDRRSRLRGNLAAARDLLRGTLDPRNILKLDESS